MSGKPGHLDAARGYHFASRWVEACREYAAADRTTSLTIDDLESWAEAAQVIGRIDEAITVLAQDRRGR